MDEARIGRALVLDLIATARGRGIGRVEVTANQHALAFYEKAGFVIYREEATRFGPAPRMRLDVDGLSAGRASPSSQPGSDRVTVACQPSSATTRGRRARRRGPRMLRPRRARAAS